MTTITTQRPTIAQHCAQPYYQRAGVTLWNADCLDVLPGLSGEVVITDPPYNAGKNYGPLTSDRRDWADWATWLDERLTLMLEAAPTVLMFLSQSAYRAYVRLGRHEMTWTLVWYKPLALSICALAFIPHWEAIAVFGNASRSKQRGAKWGSDVLVANVEVGQNRWNHPTPKPIQLMRDLVSRFDGPIIDPFAGSGTTLRACKDLGKTGLGIENNPAYCEVIVKRLAQEVMLLE